MKKISKTLLPYAIGTVLIFTNCSKDDDTTTTSPANKAPEIAAQSFNVSDSAADADVFGMVKATDADKDELSYSITTNSDGLFEITKTGALSLATGKTLDFDTKAVHEITVQVTDGKAKVSAKVTITVTFSPEKFIKTDEQTIVYYPFNGNADNALKSEYNGILTNSPKGVDDRNGNSNAAYSFDNEDGSSINFGKVPIDGGQYTFSFWINVPSIDPGVSSYRVLSKRLSCGVGDFIDIAFSNTDANTNRLGVEIRSDSNDLGSTTSLGANNLPVGKWVHVLITIDSDKRVTTLYFNGEMQSKSNEWTTNTNIVIFDEDAEIGIGTSPCINNVSSVKGFTGSLDDLAIFSRVLTANEIKNLASE